LRFYFGSFVIQPALAFALHGWQRSAKDRLNAKRAKKIGKQQREYIPYDWALIFI
jgi:hypothetical protein